MKTKNKNILKTAGILLLGILFGWLIFGVESDRVDHDHTELTQDQIWTCSMHPQIRQTEPGDCPICGMDLIPLEAEETGVGAGTGFQMSENALRLANVSTETVGGTQAQKELRLNGKVQVDERNAYAQSSHIPGRIEQLTVNFTGERVQRGQTLATVYSPQLVTAQQELLQAASIRESQPELFEAAQERLRSWKISQAQIDRIVSSSQPIQNFPIRADVGGVVTEKLVNLGDYVERGMPIYEISDLSKVWVLFDLYESDLAWVNEGDQVEYTVRSIPGETFQGKIDFIDPIIDPQTRVATARIEVDNRDGRLKPGMFATGIVKTAVGSSDDQQIVIPKSAVLWTGTRSVVYVKEGSNGFQMREVTLGRALGNSYIVQAGLESGEEIVTNGAFTVDAAVQLSGRPSMMNPDLQQGQPSGTGHDHEVKIQESHLEVQIGKDAKRELEKILNSYIAVKDALVNDNYAGAKQKASELNSLFGSLNISFPSTEEKIWESYKKELRKAARQISSAGNIEKIRNGFDELSETMIGMVKTFQLGEGTLYVQHCPMADNDRGADWLSLSSEVQNPYFGSAMLKCGEVKETIQ